MNPTLQMLALIGAVAGLITYPLTTIVALIALFFVLS